MLTRFLSTMVLLLLPTFAGDHQASQTSGASSDPISGQWKAVAFYETVVPFTLTLKLEGNKVTGTIATEEGSAELRGASWDDGVLTFEASYMNAPVLMKASVKDGALVGTWSYNGGEATGRWEGTRKAE